MTTRTPNREIIGSEINLLSDEDNFLSYDWTNAIIVERILWSEWNWRDIVTTTYTERTKPTTNRAINR
jgi:hypothetical protein